MQKKLRAAIIVLAVLLALSGLALAGVLAYGGWQGPAVAKAVVAGNRIAARHGKNSPTALPDVVQSNAEVLRFHWLHSGDNKPFQVANMFPGDAETQYYCVRVTHTGPVSLRFRADVRDGYEKLAEVLQCRVALLTGGEPLYDGLLRDMPEELVHPLPAQNATDELYYEVTAYLDTSVGNDYQLQTLAADLRWWVEETGNLGIPQTGDAGVAPYAVAALLSAVAVTVLLRTRKKEDADHAG